jgi:hypothetical protein
VVDIESTDKVPPMIVDECKKEPKASLWQRVKAEWRKAEAEMKKVEQKVRRTL